jgi:23S rRNA (guanosine2251-2'-O)-methyltransferase
MAGGKGGGQGGRGAKEGSHRKGAAAGSGGKRRRALAGKGPTPAAEQRTKHPAARRAAATVRLREESARPRDSSRLGPSRPGPRERVDGTGTETVIGRNSVLEALRAEVPATALYVASMIDTDERVREILRWAGDRRIPLLEAPRPELDRLAGGAVHQGVALKVPPYPYAHPDDLIAGSGSPVVVALDGVTDPRNLGAVVRSVAAFGGRGVLIPQRRSAGMTAGAWKASVGAAARVPVARATNLTRALVAYRKAGLLVVGLDAGGDTAIDEVPGTAGPVVLVVGGEGNGLSRLVRETCDLVAGIPMSAGTESLNASVAAGIVLYDIARRRRVYAHSGT